MNPLRIFILFSFSLSLVTTGGTENSPSETRPEINTRTADDIQRKRTEIVERLWFDEKFPLCKLPKRIQKNIKDNRFQDLKNLNSIDKLTMETTYGLNSIAYLFHPKNKRDRVLIYHEGHNGDFHWGKRTIGYFLRHGYTILALAMPLKKPNNRPTVKLKSGREIRLKEHNQLRELESPDFNPLRLFLEPVAIGIHYLEKNYGYDEFSMVGISGGGWTTTLYAALDPRIKLSFPVAGSLPLYLREKDKGIDYEYFLPGLLDITNYLELYAMGAFGKGRGQLQILNKNDPCCLSGERHKTYTEPMEKIMKRLGKGSFRVFSDDTHIEHKISDKALKFIHSTLKKGGF